MGSDSQISAGLTLAGRYTVLEPISAGAMGAVYRAHDSELGKDVALVHGSHTPASSTVIPLTAETDGV